MKRKLPLHAAHLRLLALGLMLLDHLWAAIVPGNDWMTMLGRLAFPIFAFQIAEGYYHTSNYKRYVRRLLIFALVSEIPFNLLLASSVMYPFHQNVMFTLLLGLVGVRAMDRAKQENTSSQWLKSLGVVLLVSLLGAITFSDYGACGVLTVVAFGVLRDVPYAKAAQAVAMILLHGVFMEGRVFMLGSMEIPMQSFAVLALPLIWLYNGEKGRGGRLLQIGSYVFYPAHMVILHLIRTVF